MAQNDVTSRRFCLIVNAEIFKTMVIVRTKETTIGISIQGEDCRTICPPRRANKRRQRQ